MEISSRQAQQLRLRGQQLYPRLASAKKVVQVVTDVCGVQAQEAEAGALSVRVRCDKLMAKDVERAQIRDKTIVRTWAMRGTLHLVPADDLPWMLSLFGPVFIRAGRKRRLELGLDEETSERGVRLLRDLLGKLGPLTKAEIAENLSAKGILMEGQASIHLIGLAAMQGWVCYGPDREKKPAFVLLEDWLGKKIEISAEQGIEELVRQLVQRYLAAFAPATLEDFVAWSGLYVRDCRAALEQIAGQLIEVKVEGSTAWMLKSQMDELDNAMDSQPIVRLLPRYDTYLLGYKDRSLIIDPKYVKRIYPGGGLLHPALLVDGKVAGTWKMIRKRGRIEVEIEPFVDFSDEVQRQLEREMSAVTHFFE